MCTGGKEEATTTTRGLGLECVEPSDEDPENEEDNSIGQTKDAPNSITKT